MIAINRSIAVSASKPLSFSVLNYYYLRYIDLYSGTVLFGYCSIWVLLQFDAVLFVRQFSYIEYGHRFYMRSMRKHIHYPDRSQFVARANQLGRISG